MSFLGRRKSNRPFTDTVNLGVVHEHFLDHSPTPSIKSNSNLRRRLSSFTLLSPKRARSNSSQPTHYTGGGVGFIAAYRNSALDRSPPRSPSPTESFDEIRRPSGLGRRASITGDTAEERWTGSGDVEGFTERKRSISSPELFVLPEGLLRWSDPSLSDAEDMEDEILPEPICMFTKVPADLLKAIFSFTSPADLASASLACKAFVGPTRILLYQDIDLVHVTDTRRVERCISLLASRRDLAGLVKRFACGTSRSSIDKASFSLVTLAIALNNMHDLTSLTLPRFDSHLLFHTIFRLKKLAFLCESTTVDELHGLIVWLGNQTVLTSLSFPYLKLDDETVQSLTGSGSQEQTLDEAHGAPLPHSILSSRLLSKLSHFHGPASLAAALSAGRPLTTIRLPIHSTLYDGLRPSALMADIARTTCPLTHLAVIADPQSRVDARTIERLLMSAGSELGEKLQVLEVECALEDEVRHCMRDILPKE
ncbi:hypothetical protein PHLCEN_2v5478 [Hermanssonia centrifuga]|uniref:F-box domain-containing protein n=1 Tax=Hermanssonia centrifuga TaxID=98765 RepID=A0A2R6P260_9APHY|nr:hypothetical protein PHLCEN_2v5478 [Hermanssonia centrifuga]